ncbi:hypothetical protein B296_00012567, partial [Ensete ventricosum]
DGNASREPRRGRERRRVSQLVEQETLLSPLGIEPSREAVDVGVVLCGFVRVLIGHGAWEAHHRPRSGYHAHTHTRTHTRKIAIISAGLVLVLILRVLQRCKNLCLGDRIKCDLGSFHSTSFFCRGFSRRAVNTLREELQLLASSRSVTIVTCDGSGFRRNGVTAIIVVGALGYVFIWWKGWKLSDMMFVTRRGLSDACTRVGKQLELLSSSIAAAKRQLSSRMDSVDSNLDECKELAAATKCEVSQLHGDLSMFHTEVESVHRAVQTLETKLGRIEGSQ